MSEPAIELRGLQHRYDTKLVLRDVDLTIEQGQILGFLGLNGAGQRDAVMPDHEGAAQQDPDEVGADHDLHAGVGRRGCRPPGRATAPARFRPAPSARYDEPRLEAQVSTAGLSSERTSWTQPTTIEPCRCGGPTTC